jgi:hypothetical protein
MILRYCGLTPALPILGTQHKEKTMHRTSSTLISDVLVKLHELDDAINGDDFNWMASDEKFATIVSGMHIIHKLTERFQPDVFDEDEVEFMNGLIGECNDIICELTADIEDCEEF